MHAKTYFHSWKSNFLFYFYPVDFKGNFHLNKMTLSASSHESLWNRIRQLLLEMTNIFHIPLLTKFDIGGTAEWPKILAPNKDLQTLKCLSTSHEVRSLNAKMAIEHLRLIQRSQNKLRWKGSAMAAKSDVVGSIPIGAHPPGGMANSIG